MKIVLFFATSFFVQMTFAAMIVASYGNSPVDKNLSTRILVVGRGKELYYLLQEAAIAKAHKLKEVFPSDQIVLVTVAETGLSENKNFLRTRSFQPLSESSNDFTPDRLLAELLKWKKIESIDFYTHNSAHLGMQLEDADTRFGINYTQFAQLKSNLTKESYIILQGCNTGFWLAPNMSKWLGIPVAGSLTGTNVHHLHSNGYFFDFDEPKKPVGPWADLNSSSYQQPVSCKNGGCLRTKPDNEVYAGTWGNFSGGGLPIYKFFCVNNSQQDCQKAMARSLYGFISTKTLSLGSSKTEFTEVLKDYFCPISKSSDIREKCISSIEASLQNGNEGYSPYRARQLQCTYQKCEFSIDCSKFFGKIIPGTCDLYNPNKSATTFMREYKDFLMGFDLIH